MIIDGKRYEGVQTYKKKGSDTYVMDIPSEHSGHWYTVTTFWNNVTTEDLKENWLSRFFQQKIPAARAEVIESDTAISSNYWRPVSWSKVPDEWKQLFKETVNKRQLIKWKK